jgi:hypothetical protein
MNEKVTVAVISAMVGFSFPFFASLWERFRRAHRIELTLLRELLEVVDSIEEKMAWVGRDVTGFLDKVEGERVVKYDGKLLFLGEREEFAVERAYWKAKYPEIAEAINRTNYLDFYRMYTLAGKFERKFHDMKVTFETSYGKKDWMAVACFHDLKKLSDDLGAKFLEKADDQTRLELLTRRESRFGTQTEGQREQG